MTTPSKAVTRYPGDDYVPNQPASLPEVGLIDRIRQAVTGARASLSIASTIEVRIMNAGPTEERAMEEMAPGASLDITVGELHATLDALHTRLDTIRRTLGD